MFIRIGLLSPVRLLGEAVALALTTHGPGASVSVMRELRDLRTALRTGARFDVVIIDTTQPIDLAAVRAFHHDQPDLPLLALGMREQEQDIVAHGSAGFLSYLPREDGLDRLSAIVRDAVDGRFPCSPEVAATIMRGLFHNGVPAAPAAAATLTPREREIRGLVARGYSNKEIARSCDLSESTVKHHVHHILGKHGFASRIQLIRTMRSDPWDSAPALRVTG